MNNLTCKKSENKKKFKFPHSFIILFIIIVAMTALTYLIPAGQFSRKVVDGKTVVDVNSFKYIPRTPVGIFEMFKCIPKGIQETSPLIIMILTIGGAINLINGTGAIKSAILHLNKLRGKEKSHFVLVGILLFFGCLGAFPGMLEAAIPFAPITIGISLALGYDVIVGMSLPLIGIVLGFTAGPSNPWNVGVGQSIAELPMFSGIVYRLIIFAIFMIVSAIYVLRYAKKVKLDPTKSMVYDMDFSHLNIDNGTETKFDFRNKLVLLIFVTTIAVIVYGTLNLKWTVIEMSAVYIIGAIVAGIAAGYDGEKIVNEILEGGKTIFTGAMAIGIAKSIQIIMNSGNISDTIIRAISSSIAGFKPMVTGVIMFLVQSIINFLIPSGSGQAMITLPSMIPAADIVGLNRQIAILAFQLGDGISNLCFPTVGVLVGFLMYTKIPFNKWFKYIMPLIGVLYLIAIMLLVVATGINYGPF
ncbi:YfcC family protein [Hathewaya histolytica]|uniref:YfcC family protein n=1 Tax=Hathewaya histolytica TaxID=1498 RepID=UPI003B66DF96